MCDYCFYVDIFTRLLNFPNYLLEIKCVINCLQVCYNNNNSAVKTLQYLYFCKPAYCYNCNNKTLIIYIWLSFIEFTNVNALFLHKQ